MKGRGIMRQKRIATRNDYFRMKVRQGRGGSGFNFTPSLQSLFGTHLDVESPVLQIRIPPP